MGGPQVYTENFLRLMRNLNGPAPERLRGIQFAEIYVGDAEAYAKKATLFAGASAATKPTSSRQSFAPAGHLGKDERLTLMNGGIH